VTLPRDVEVLCATCFIDCFSILSFKFQRNARLVRIEANAFFGCSQLESICIPASVEIICHKAFGECDALSSVSFERDSRLREIEENAFFACAPMDGVLLPASLQILDGLAFATTEVEEFMIEGESPYLDISDDFVVDAEGVSVVRYFGRDDPDFVLDGRFEVLCDRSFGCCWDIYSFAVEPGSRLTRIGREAFQTCIELESIHLPASVEVLGEKCFAICEALSSLTFEAGSRLARVEAKVFLGCISLKLVSIPGSIQEMVKGWSRKSSLRSVIFQSAGSLRTMIEKDNVDLSGKWELNVAACDCELDFPGYSVDSAPGIRNSIHLLKIHSQT
jgi:hypothetical protein